MKARHRDFDGEKKLPANAVIAARIRKAVLLEMREAAGVLPWARLVMKEAASSLQRPHTSIPKPTRRHLELRRS